MTDEHKGLPVSGYKAQSDANVREVNLNKQLEEAVLQQIDKMSSVWGRDQGYDQRMIAIAKTQIEGGFMWLNRAVFKPERVVLGSANEKSE